MLLLLFFSAWFYKNWVKKDQVKHSFLIENNDRKILQIDSSISRIPYAYDDSTRSEFLKNYSKFR
jgi:hypothetical protein